ncbi:MAG: pseudouridine synthase, partial [Lewinella sp.]|nr:pseudouridine synthase [Lewinella sp.]
EPLQTKPQPIYLLLHKPPGITCTTDTKEKDNIIDFLRYPQRIFPVGRLDKASSGLLLLTNDGDLVNQVLRVENKHEKEYIVTVDRVVTAGFLQRMGGGLPILGKMTNPCQVEKMGKHLFRIVLTQGMNRQIRRMCEYLGYRVVTLKRVRIMHLELGRLALGKHRPLSAEELTELQARLANKST